MRYALAACLLFVGACSSSSKADDPTAVPPAPKPTQSAPVAALNKIGWFCDPSPGAAEAHTVTNEICRIDGENVSVYTFATDTAKETWRTEVYDRACEILVGRTLYTVEDGLYVIAPVSEKMARDLAAALPATLRSLSC